MTTMTHKSLEARRLRRTRLKRAVRPIMELFHCTQMEVANHVAHLIRERDSLYTAVEVLKAEIQSLKSE